MRIQFLRLLFASSLMIGIVMSGLLALVMAWACWAVFKSGWRLKT